MKTVVLFIQGGGEGAYKVDAVLAAALQEALGADFLVKYPRMPREEDPDYAAWKEQISKELATVDGRLVLVGHSVGGSVLLRYLFEVRIKKPVAGIFFLATPYWGAEEWLVDGSRLQENLAGPHPDGPPIFFYHNRDDEVVPFAHLAMFTERIPHPTYRAYDQGGHQFIRHLNEVAAEIANLQ